MKSIKLVNGVISKDGPCYVIAEIGHNHQGNLKTALEMIKIAAECGADAVKFQKRDNKTLFTKALFNKPYDNENSYGQTYGEHREFLEFGEKEYRKLKSYAEEVGVDFMSTAFDFKSADFLENLDVSAYKIASGDITNIPLLTYIAKFGKPMVVSTGAATMDEVKMAYDAILEHNDKLCLLHCVASYPTDYEKLNLSFIKTMKEEFPEAIIGYSGHDSGILAPTLAYMLGANVVEKHFTLNRAWKGTDHKFSLEPVGLRKMVRDLRRVDISMGNGVKEINEYEKEARMKMGKSIYAARNLRKGEVITEDDICFKTPHVGLSTYMINEVLGKSLKRDIEEDEAISLDHLE